MLKKKYLLFFSLFLLVVFLFTSCLPKPPVTEGILKGQVMVPEGPAQAKDLTGQALPNATVNIIDLATGDIIATTTTDANGYYQVFVLPGGPYLLQAVKEGLKVQQVTPQVEVGIEYDLGTADCTTTAAALIVQAMLEDDSYPDDPADINLTDIEADQDFNDVMSIVCSIIEAGEDPAVSALVQQAVEDFLNPPTPTPTPTPTVPAATLSSIAITTPATKLSYSIGDALDIAGLVVTGTYSDTTTKVESITTGNVTDFNSSAPAVDQVLTITVGDKTTTYMVTIVATPIADIAAITGTPKVGVELTAGALTPAGATATYQWQICATSGGTYTNITGATGTTYTPVAGDAAKLIKVVAIGTGNYSGTVTSEVTTAVTNAEQAAPTGLAGVAPTTYGGANGKITGTITAMEYKLSTEPTTWTPATVTEITGLAAGTYQVRYAAKAGFNAGTAADVVVPVGPNAEQAAPIGLTGVAPTTYGGANGKITGTITAMEYKLSTATGYTAATVTEITGLVAGIYQVRYAAKAGFNAGTAADVLVPALAIGHSYGGGKVAYLLVSGDPGYDANVQHGLIAATADQSAGIAWSNITGTLVGTTGIEIGDGQANTNAMKVQTGYTGGAARVCDDYTNTETGTGVYTDWFLPSINELHEMYHNRVAIGVFAGSRYWSSSETSSSSSLYQSFGDDSQGGSNKSSAYHVRAVRAF
jgi:hypothetical protein